MTKRTKGPKEKQKYGTCKHLWSRPNKVCQNIRQLPKAEFACCQVTSCQLPVASYGSLFSAKSIELTELGSLLILTVHSLQAIDVPVSNSTLQCIFKSTQVQGKSSSISRRENCAHVSGRKKAENQKRENERSRI